MKKALLCLAVISKIFLGVGMAQDVITKMSPRNGSYTSFEIKAGEVCDVLNVRGTVSVASHPYPDASGTGYGENDFYVYLSNGSSTSTSGTTAFPLAGPCFILLQSDGLISYRIRANTSSSTSTPANAVVIPTDATGSVQIILESSTDLITWTQANPGAYGASTTKRFFRIRAVNQ